MPSIAVHARGFREPIDYFWKSRVNGVNIFSPLKNKSECSSKFVGIDALEDPEVLGDSQI